MIMKNKWLFGSMLSLALTAGMFAGTAISSQAAEGDVEINETNFPDEYFRSYVNENLDSNSNGVLSKEEIESVTEIEYYSYKEDTTDLTGINIFCNLESLICHNVNLSSLDISKLSNLTELECSNNQLSSLNISKNTKLTYLDCSDNNLTSLDVSKNTKLTYLSCDHNNLSSLDVSKLSNLTVLRCGWNQINSLDVSKNTNLEYLVCSSNNLTSLDVSKNTNLETLGCRSNDLTSLDVSKNTKLTRVECAHSGLKKLDVSKCTKLEYLDCMKNNLSSLNFSKNTKLTELYCSNNNLTKLDMSNCKELKLFIAFGNKLKTLNLDNCKKIEDIYCPFNNLACLNLDTDKLLSNKLAVSSCTRYVSVNSDNQFDLSKLDGFNVKRASSWSGGKVSGNTLTFTSDTVTYTYDTGARDSQTNEKLTIEFTLKKCTHKENTVKKTTKATFSENGVVKTVCNDCGKTVKKSTIYKMETPKLSKTTYTYNGKAKKPSVTVKDSKGTELKKDTHYTVSYASGRKNVGTYKVTIKGKGKYTGSVTKTFKIIPPKTAVSKLSAGTKAFTVKWSKKTTQTTGYQIQYSLKKDFTDATVVSVKDNTVTSKKVTKLKAGKKYYVRVRTYKKVSDKNYYSGWSEAKTVTTKK